MKNILIFFTILFLNSILFAENRTVINSKNEFKGITEEITFEKGENEQLVKFQIYYNDENIVVKHDYFLTPEISKETGIQKQIVFYDENQNITKYVMYYNDNYYKIHGVSKLIEYVSNGAITLLEYYKEDLKIDYLYDMETADKYPFYKLNYLTTQMIDNERINDGNDFIDLSAKYWGLRSFVLFNGEIEPLNETDKMILDYTGKHINWPNILNYYSSKMLIEEDGEKYTMYIQNGLEDKIPMNLETTIRYYTIGFNGHLYLTMVNILKK